MARGSIGPVLILVAGAGLFVAAGRLPVVPVPGQLGPDFWPRVVLAGLMASSILKLLERRAAGQQTPDAAIAEPEASSPISLPKLAAGIALLVGYPALTPVIGYALTNFFFLLAFMWLAGLRRPVALLLTGALGTVALLYIFARAVYLPLPKGAGPMEDFTIFVYRLLRIF